MARAANTTVRWVRLKGTKALVTHSIVVRRPDLLAHVEAVARAVGLLDRNCVFNMQFRRGADGTWRLQEANPRPSGGSHLAAGLGSNLIAAAAALELGIPFPEPETPPAGTTVTVILDAFPVPALSETSLP